MAFIGHPGRSVGILDIVKAGFIGIPAREARQAPVEVVFRLAPRRYLVLAHEFGVWFAVAFVPYLVAGFVGDGQEEPDLIDGLIAVVFYVDGDDRDTVFILIDGEFRDSERRGRGLGALRLWFFRGFRGCFRGFLRCRDGWLRRLLRWILFGAPEK